MAEFMTAKKQQNINTQLKLLDMTVRLLMVRLGVEKLQLTADEYLSVQRRVTHYILQSDLSVHITMEKSSEADRASDPTSG